MLMLVGLVPSAGRAAIEFRSGLFGCFVCLWKLDLADRLPVVVAVRLQPVESLFVFEPADPGPMAARSSGDVFVVVEADGDRVPDHLRLPVSDRHPDPE